MAVTRRQKPSRSIHGTPPAPVVNIAERRSKREALQPGRKTSVFLAVPTLNGFTHFSTAMAFGRAMASTMVPECPFQFGIHVEPGKRPIDYGRNAIVATFLDQTDADWLLMWDDDEGVPDNFWQLCTVSDADVVGGLVPVWVGHMDAEAMLRVNNYGVDAQGRCYNLPAPPESVTQPYLVPVVGTGAIAIRRRVFAPPPAGVGRHPFRFTYDETGRVLAGEDVNFSVACQRVGFRLAVHPQVRFDHVKPLQLSQVKQYHEAAMALVQSGKSTTDTQRLSLG